MKLRNPPLQRMLDEQGYLIVASTRDKAPGTVLGGCRGGRDDKGQYSDVPGPLAVIGSASRGEWVAQHERYAGCAPRTDLRDHFFLKVIAE